VGLSTITSVWSKVYFKNWCFCSVRAYYDYL